MSSTSKSPEIIYDLTDESNSVSNGSLTNWNKNDLFQLYLGIKYQGSGQLKAIKAGFLPNKTEEEIKEAIMCYRENVNKSPAGVSSNTKRRAKPKPLIPLARWAKLLTDNLNYKELQTETASALRLIADLESMPSPKLTEQIDFRQIYHCLADVMEGKAPPNDRLIEDMLSSCVLNTALVSKSFIKLSQLRNIVGNVNVSDKDLTGFPRPTIDAELAVIRDFLVQRNYNPLHITEESLVAPSNDTPTEK